MDKRLTAMLAVCVVELLMRALYMVMPFDPLLHTLATRVIQVALILALARDDCGMRTGSLGREILLGLLVSAAFGAAVMGADLASRLAIPGGILSHLLVKQVFKNYLLYLGVGCLAAPLAEEIFFRGLCYAWLRERLPVSASVAISAVFFASMHGMVVPVQLIGGIAFALVYEWRKNVWAACVLHMLANTGIWVYPYLLELITRR